MHVVATAGHVDHGKSTLVEALTGMQSDRLAEEKRRGLSIDLGYAWTGLGAAGDVAFVDVPGHERFVSTMLAGVGPVPAVLFVAAADDPWMPQAAEHLAALDAFGVQHVVVAVTRCDLADPTAAMASARSEIGRTSLIGPPVVPVSAHNGCGLDELRMHLAATLTQMPAPDPTADVRFWVDRRFTVRGAGTIITGTLQAGRVAQGDLLLLGAASGAPIDARVRVRGLQSLSEPVASATGVARVALNVSGAPLDLLGRGSVLVTPDRWHFTDTVDVRVVGEVAALPRQANLHIGSAAVPVRSRPLGSDTARLVLSRALPLRVGDRALLRDPGSRRLRGLVVLDPAPPGLRRRGAGAQRAAALAPLTGVPDTVSEVERREVVTLQALERIGVPPGPVPQSVVVAGHWLVSGERAARAAADATRLILEHDRRRPLDPGVPLTALTKQLALPDPAIVAAVATGQLRIEGGRVLTGQRAEAFPPRLEEALATLERDLARSPFAAPTAARLVELGLDTRAVAAAAKAGRVLRLDHGVLLLAGADLAAAALLGGLPQPFTTSQARIRLATSRRVVMPLLGHLDQIGLTQRLRDDRRTMTEC